MFKLRKLFVPRCSSFLAFVPAPGLSFYIVRGGVIPRLSFTSPAKGGRILYSSSLATLFFFCLSSHTYIIILLNCHAHQLLLAVVIMAISVNADDLMKYYGVTENDCNCKIEDVHLQIISSTLCKHWKKLPAHLNTPSIKISDIERDFKTEEERRSAFFSQWRDRDGSAATYKRLIAALLDIDCRDDAEGVCKLLKKSSDSRQEKSEESQEEKPIRTSTPVKLEENSSPALPKLAKGDSALKLSNAPGTLS